MVKPLFVPKPRRDTVVERERMGEERRRLEELVRRRMEERRAETRRIVLDVIKDESIHNEEPLQTLTPTTTMRTRRKSTRRGRTVKLRGFEGTGRRGEC